MTEEMAQHDATVAAGIRQVLLAGLVPVRLLT